MRGLGWHLQMGRQIMKLLGEWGAPGLAKLQKNDKRPKAVSATPPSRQCFYPTAPSFSSRFRLSRDGERCRKSFAPGEVKQGGSGGFCMVVGGASSVSGAPCRLLFPKVFLFSSARPATTPAATGETRAGILRHCQRHFVCFIIFYYHQVFVPSLSSLVFLLFFYFAPS